MNQIKKVKPYNIGIPLLGGSVSLSIFLVLWLYFSYKAAYGFLGLGLLVLALFNLVYLIRTKNTSFIAVFLFVLSTALLNGSFSIGIANFEGNLHPVFPLILIFFLISFALYLFILFSRKAKWRKREVLELAAKPVAESENGFTSRPCPIGKADYMKEDIESFAKFILKHLIAIPYYESRRIVFVITGKVFMHMMNLSRDYSKETWIAFDFDGNISVNISKTDYLSYKDDISFDQLCESLSNLFIEFLELYKRENGIRIIDRMNELRETVWT